jgi:proteic killer suppression protein
MIGSWKNANSRRVLETGEARGFRGLDAMRAAMRLKELNAARTLADLSPLKSVGLHKLVGDRRGQWAVTVNGPWRVVFTVGRDGAFEDVEIVDYHKG